MLRFFKMQGAGNDYIFIDCRTQRVNDPAGLARKISDRRFGIGSDGLILLSPSSSAHLQMRIFNADGSEAEMCGNGARCAAAYAWKCGWASADPLLLATQAGIRELRRLSDGRISVTMGRPEIRDALPLSGRRELKLISMGNPHGVLFVRDVAHFPLARVAAEVSRQTPLNLEVVQVDGQNRLLARVFERGSGETAACGTGACACAAAAVSAGFCAAGEEISVQMPGGPLSVRYLPDGQLLLAGEAKMVFEGTWEET